jgi:hypothetical protein
MINFIRIEIFWESCYSHFFSSPTTTSFSEAQRVVSRFLFLTACPAIGGEMNATSKYAARKKLLSLKLKM